MCLVDVKFLIIMKLSSRCLLIDFLGGIVESDSAHCIRLVCVYVHVCHLIHLCTLLKPLDGMRWHLTRTLVWSLVTLCVAWPQSPMERGDLELKPPVGSDVAYCPITFNYFGPVCFPF